MKEKYIKIKDWNRFRLNRINRKSNQNRLIENRIKKIESIMPAQITKIKSRDFG